MSRLRDWSGHRWIGLAARLYLGWVFLTACWHKILHPELFALDVAAYELLPTAAVNLVALTLPWVELTAGLLLVIGLRTRAAALLITSMMVVFLVALCTALLRGLDMSCGCFAPGVGEADPISGWTLLRDLGWLALALHVLLFDRQPLGLDRLFGATRARPVSDQAGVGEG